MRQRIRLEFELLVPEFPQIEHREHDGEDWFCIPRYPYPAGIWNRNESAVAFRALASFPSAVPYGFWVPAALRLADTETAPDNYVEPAPEPPFSDVTWARFSWATTEDWQIVDEPTHGTNLLHFARSFRRRLEEGK